VEGPGRQIGRQGGEHLIPPEQLVAAHSEGRCIDQARLAKVNPAVNARDGARDDPLMLLCPS
jgi:hypothetical protein